jgi:hypothetical protein
MDWRWTVFTARLEGATEWTPPVQLSGIGNGTWPSSSPATAVRARAAEARPRPAR